MSDLDRNTDDPLPSERKQLVYSKVKNAHKYFHHRMQKRKKFVEKCAIENSNSSAEEERQFKLKRFVQDIDQFVKEKELTKHSCEKGYQKTSQKNEARRGKDQAKRKSKPAMPLMKRGLFQNGVQTQFYSRGALGRETTARLDENLRQIIALASKENVCQCIHHCQQPSYQPALTAVTKPYREPLKPCNSRVSASFTSGQRNLSSPSSSVSCRDVDDDRHQSLPSLDELDSKLYLEVTRTVTNSCIESMSKQFKNKSYLTIVKGRLLDIYLQGKKKNSQHSCCTSDAQSSRAVSQSAENNSPLTQGQLGSAMSHTQTTQDSEHTFKEIHFVSQPSKSTMEFLEETLGPGPSWKAVHGSPELQQYHQPPSPFIRGISPPKCQRPNTSRGVSYFHPTGVSPTYNYSTETLSPGPSCKTTLVSPKLQQYHPPPSPPIRKSTKCQWADASAGPKHLHPTSVSSTYNYPASNADDVWSEWIHLHSNTLNYFLPSAEGYSPEFQYFPRKMF